MNAIRYRICKYVDNAKVTDNVSVMKNLIGKLAATAIEPTVTKPTVVFDNDVNPNSMVCWEGHCIVDESGRWKIVDEKRYPAIPLAVGL
jgi:hypothetical protein